MQNCLGKLNLTYGLIYLHDAIVFSKTEEEHLCLIASENIIWGSSWLSVNYSKMWSTIWPTMYLRRASGQEGEPKSCGSTHPSSNIDWNPSLSRFGRTLPVIHQRICMCCTTTAWTPIWGRCQQEEQVSNTHEWCAGCLWDSLESMPWGPCTGFC